MSIDTHHIHNTQKCVLVIVGIMMVLLLLYSELKYTDTLTFFVYVIIQQFKTAAAQLKLHIYHYCRIHYSLLTTLCCAIIIIITIPNSVRVSFQFLCNLAGDPCEIRHSFCFHCNKKKMTKIETWQLSLAKSNNVLITKKNVIHLDFMGMSIYFHPGTMCLVFCLYVVCFALVLSQSLF